MTLILMAVGLIFAAVGSVAIGFGIPINAFSLGNTLIVSGTVAFASGMILIGLALVLGQLRRILETLKNGALVRADSTEPAAPPVARAASVSVPASLAAPAMPEQQTTEPPSEPRVSEPRFPATANEPAPGPLDWLRVKSKPVTASTPSASIPTASMPQPTPESQMVEVTDEAPLSPRPPPRTTMPPPSDPVNEPKVWSPSREVSPPEARPGLRAEPQQPRATPQVEPPKEKERFDLVWPDRAAAPTPAPSEPKVEVKREPTLEMPMPPVPARPRETRPPAERRMPELTRKPSERGPAILKSGVIDGMPYTLYADGSIEAQLPQGMVKFASVDALRTHLEKQG